MMAERAVEEIRDLLGDNPVERICWMEAEERKYMACELHKRLCGIFSLDVELVMGEAEYGYCGCYINRKNKYG